VGTSLYIKKAYPYAGTETVLLPYPSTYLSIMGAVYPTSFASPGEQVIRSEALTVIVALELLGLYKATPNLFVSPV